MIKMKEYFWDPKTQNHKPHGPELDFAASDLLSRVNALLAEVGWHWPIDPDTGSCISGAHGGSGDGGYRLPSATTGVLGSRHRLAKAVDVYDPVGYLYDFITDDLLEKHGLYREHKDHTPGWVHLQSVAPKSGNRTFIP